MYDLPRTSISRSITRWKELSSFKCRLRDHSFVTYAKFSKKLTFLTPSLRKKCPYSELFWSVFSRIQSNYGKIRTRITLTTDTFHTVLDTHTYVILVNQGVRNNSFSENFVHVLNEWSLTKDLMFKTLVPKAPFLFPLKTSEICFLIFSEVEKEYIGNEWVNISLRGILYYSLNTRFFITNTFISNLRLKWVKNQAKAKQHPEAELLQFEKCSFFIHVIIEK